MRYCRIPREKERWGRKTHQNRWKNSAEKLPPPVNTLAGTVRGVFGVSFVFLSLLDDGLDQTPAIATMGTTSSCPDVEGLDREEWQPQKRNGGALHSPRRNTTQMEGGGSGCLSRSCLCLEWEPPVGEKVAAGVYGDGRASL